MKGKKSKITEAASFPSKRISANSIKLREEKAR